MADYGTYYHQYYHFVDLFILSSHCQNRQLFLLYSHLIWFRSCKSITFENVSILGLINAHFAHFLHPLQAIGVKTKNGEVFMTPVCGYEVLK